MLITYRKENGAYYKDKDKVKAYLRVIKPEWILLYSDTIREK